MMMYWGSAGGADKQGLDFDGQPFRSQTEYPYSYSPFVVYARDGECRPIREDGVTGVYSDRMRTWCQDNGGDFYALVTEHFGPRVGDNFTLSLPPLVESFLQQQLNKPKLVLRQIIQYCNLATGYPVWYLAYESGEPQEARKLTAPAAAAPRAAAKRKPAAMTTGKARKQHQPAQAKVS